MTAPVHHPASGASTGETSLALVAAFPFYLRWDATGVIVAAGRGWGLQAQELLGQPWFQLFRSRTTEPVVASVAGSGGEPESLTLEAMIAGPNLHGPCLRQWGGETLYLGTPLGPLPAVGAPAEPWAPAACPPWSRQTGAGLRLATAIWQSLAEVNAAAELLPALVASLGRHLGAWWGEIVPVDEDGTAAGPATEWSAPGVEPGRLAELRARPEVRQKRNLDTGTYPLGDPAEAFQLAVLHVHHSAARTVLIRLILPPASALPATGEGTVPLLAQLLSQFLRRDQAERAWANERSLTQNVLELMGQGLTVSDGEGRWIYVNSAYARLAQRSVEELVGSRPDYLAAPEDLPVLAEARRLRGLGQANTYEMTIIRPDGSRLPVLVSGVPRLVDGRPAGAVAVATDLTVIKETERRMQAALLREQELNREKNAFMRLATHEYRTPVATITYAAELLAGRLAELAPAGDPKRIGRLRRHAQLIWETALQMNRLMDNLMLLWRLQTQEVQLLPKRVNVSGLVEELLLVAGQAGQAERLRLVVEPGTPQTFPLDAQMFRLVVLNLIDNALKYSPADQPVTVRLAQPPAGHLRVAVEDCGPGIPPGERERIFNAFYRGTNVADQPGTGIGLTIAQRCARLHGGEVSCESGGEIGGTRFLFRVSEILPRPCELANGI